MTQKYFRTVIPGEWLNDNVLSLKKNSLCMHASFTHFLKLYTQTHGTETNHIEQADVVGFRQALFHEFINL